MFRAFNLAAKQTILFSVALFVTALLASSQTATATHDSQAVTPQVRAVLDAIQAADLQGNLSFLSSDALAGRYTPSPGLEIAAEFIASQFRAAGLQPAGNHDYFQIASLIDRKIVQPASPLVLHNDTEQATIPAGSLSLVTISSALHLDHCQVSIVKEQTPDALKNVQVAGRAIIAPSISLESRSDADRATIVARMRAFRKVVEASDAKVLLLVGRARSAGTALLTPEQVKADRVPIVAVDHEELKKWLEGSNQAPGRTISLDLPAPEDRTVEVKNVVALLPGSDPTLKDTYVMLTAHYDHIGTLETSRGMTMTSKPNGSDRIFNGANDDGSGTVSVIEIAKALARLNPHPRRSIVFMTFFGEERGDIGSSFYGQHPLFPISRTIADLNLEQVGRTDSTEGKKVNNASVTGYDYSDLTKYLERAGRSVGIKVYKEEPASDDYFVRSDNAALAEQGVPAHTLCVAFDYSDYHGLGDEWQKVDYENMARVDRMVALGLIDLANSSTPPKWNSRNTKTEPFRAAQAKQAP